MSEIQQETGLRQADKIGDILSEMESTMTEGEYGKSLDIAVKSLIHTYILVAERQIILQTHMFEKLEEILNELKQIEGLLRIK